MYRWRRDLRSRTDHGSTFAAVITATAGAPVADTGMLEIEFPSGARLRISGAIEPNDSIYDGRGVGRRPAMIPFPSGARVWLATGHTDMRKGFDGLALLVQETLRRDPHNGHLFVSAAGAAV
jgi:hypothetical protein